MNKEQIVTSLNFLADKAANAALTLEAVSVMFTATAVDARSAGFKDENEFRDVVVAAFLPVVDNGSITKKTASNYCSYILAIYKAATLPEGLRELSLQAANKAVREANPGQYQTRKPRTPSSGTAKRAGGRGAAGAPAPAASGENGTVISPLHDLERALESLRAMAKSETALSLVAEINDLCSDLLQALVNESTAKAA